MTSSERCELYESCVATLGEMVDGGARMDDVERVIDALPVSGDEQSALWLWAIARRDRSFSAAPDRVVVGAPARERQWLGPRLFSLDARRCAQCGQPMHAAQQLKYRLGSAVHARCIRERPSDVAPL